MSTKTDMLKNHMEKTKHKLKGDESRNIFLDGEYLSPQESLKVVSHSPDGFNVGYGGSGPSQLALAIILKLKGTPIGYQDFKWKVIAKIKEFPFEIEFEL